MELDFDLGQEQHQRNLPRLIEANYLLQLSSVELEHVIATELQSNPALELDERATCPQCGHLLEGGLCAVCMATPDPPQAAPEPEEFDRYEQGNVLRSIDDEFDEVLLIADELDVLGQLLADARAALPRRDHGIAELIVESIDDQGLLSCDLSDIATMARRSPKQVASVLSRLQELAPPGVAARDLRESLTLQVRFLEQNGVQPPDLVRPIIEEHLTELAAHRYHQLSREFHHPVEDIAAAHEFIRAHLSPNPLQDSRSRTWQRSTATPFVVPDVLIDIVDDELQIEVVGPAQERLRVNDLYDRLATGLRRRSEAARAADPLVAQTSDEDRGHIRESVSRARQFIGKLRQRQETLLKISLCICQMQEDFLRGGIRELRPLTRAEVANQVGVHESTVSRATANKYVMLPNRRVIPFSDFFSPSLSVKDVIREIIESESARGETLSDMRIRDLLAERGYRIARRTVAKYRAELHILPSTVRS